MTDIQAIQALQTQPLNFLKNYSFTPYSAGAVAGVHTFYMVDPGGNAVHRPGSILGGLNRHTTQRFTARPNSIFGGTSFHAFHIPVQVSNIAINPHFLPVSGTGIMLTTELTGCSIVMIPGGGSFSVAHLQPTGETGAQLRTRLTQPGITIYGQTDYAGYRSLVVGVRLKRMGKTRNGFSEVLEDFFRMPRTMRQLAVVQFFSWFGLFAMWIYTTPAVAAVPSTSRWSRGTTTDFPFFFPPSSPSPLDGISRPSSRRARVIASWAVSGSRR